MIISSARYRLKALCLCLFQNIILSKQYLFLDKFHSLSILPNKASVFAQLSLLLTKSSFLLTSHPLNSFWHRSQLPHTIIFTSGACCLHGQTLTYSALFTTMTMHKVVALSVGAPSLLYIASLRSPPGAWHRQPKLVEFTAPPWPLPLTLEKLCYLYGTLFCSGNTDRFTSEVFQLERNISIIIPLTTLIQNSSHTKCFS